MVVVEGVRRELHRDDVRLDTVKIRRICLIVYAETVKALNEVGMLYIGSPEDYEMVLDEMGLL